ncbi:unnamed protein product [Meloidogyne enterolobii]|uniref:Uncharacterized protein n=1 Tax=Meloidogyne enterolobii TaxID=390850 RepID=A0ACB0YLE6_MELEN
MYFLPPEVQLDILKHLNFTQLLSIQQTNIYFKNFINQCESLLARKEEDQIGFSSVNELYLNEYKLYKPDPKLYEFKLSEQLEEKWKCAIDKSIPMFLSCNDDDRMNIVDVSLFESNPSSDWGQLFLNISRNIFTLFSLLLFPFAL